MAYDLADVVGLEVTIRDANGDPADGGSVVLTIGLPDGTTATPAVSHAGVGVYQVDYIPTVPGRHTVSWVCTGLNASGYSDVFDVRPATPAYIGSLAALKEQLNITSSSSDEELRLYLEASTGVVERHLKRAVVRRERTEQHSVAHGPLILNWTPVVALISVATTDGATTWDVSSLTVSSAGIVTSNGDSIRGDIETLYIAGESIIPAEWHLASVIIGQHLWESQRGDSGSPFAGGLDMPGAGITSFGFSIPNRAKELLGEPPPMVA